MRKILLIAVAVILTLCGKLPAQTDSSSNQDRQEQIEQALQELTNIYYAQNSIMAVSPVSREAIARHRGAVGRDL